MKKVFTVLFIAIATMALQAAEIPQNIIGTYKVNGPATAEFVKKNPKFKAGDEKRIPRMLERYATLTLEITADKMLTKAGKREQAVPVTLKEISGETVILQATMRGKTYFFSFIPHPKGTQIKSTASNDMDYTVWTKQ